MYPKGRHGFWKAILFAGPPDTTFFIIEAHEDKPLGALIAPHLRRVLYELDRIAGAGNKVKRGFAILRSFVGSLKLSVHDISLGLDIEPEKGAADSGDLEIDLPSTFAAVGEAADDRKSAVAIFIDEVQYFNQKELGALIMSMHKIQQRQLPIVLLGAGLPILPGLAGESRLDMNFFRACATIDRPCARRTFCARWPSSDRAPSARATSRTRSKSRSRASGPCARKLIKKGMIYSPAHGDMAFTVPLFGEFMIRAIPKFTT